MRPCIVNTSYKETYFGDFQNIEIVLDEDVHAKEDVKALGIENGDFICFDTATRVTESGYIKSRFLDDKLSAAVLIGYAKYLKDTGKTPKRQKIYQYFTVFEEIGHGASASIPEGVTDVLSVDMGCVGDGIACTEKSKCPSVQRTVEARTITTLLPNWSRLQKKRALPMR